MTSHKSIVLLMCLLGLIAVQGADNGTAGKLGETEFSFNTAPKDPDADDGGSIDSDDGQFLENFIFSQTLDSINLQSVWDITKLGNVRVAFLAMDTEGKGYVGNLLMTDGTIGFMQLTDGYAQSMISINGGDQLFIWFSNGKAAVLENDSTLTKSKVFSVPSDLVPDKQSSRVALTEDGGDVWVVGSGFVAKIDTSSTDLKSNSNFTFDLSPMDDYKYIQFSSVVAPSTDTLIVVGIASNSSELDVSYSEDQDDFTKFASVLMRISFSGSSAKIRTYVYDSNNFLTPDIRIVLSSLILDDNKDVTVVGTYERLGFHHFLWSKFTPGDFFGTVGDLLFFTTERTTALRIGGNILASSKVDSDYYYLTTSGYVKFTPETSISIYKVNSLGCAAQNSMSMLVYGDNNMNVLILGTLSYGSDTPMNILATDMANPLASVAWNVSASGAVSIPSESTITQVYGGYMPEFDAEKVSSTSSSSTDIDVVVQNATSGDNAVDMIYTAGMATYENTSAEVTIDDEYFNYDLDKLTFTNLISEATRDGGKFTVTDTKKSMYDVTFTATVMTTYVCYDASIFLPTLQGSDMYATVANYFSTVNDNRYKTAGAVVSAVNTATYYYFDTDGNGRIFLESEKMASSPLMTLDLDTGASSTYIMAAVPNSLADYIAVSANGVQRITFGTGNSWKLNRSDNGHPSFLFVDPTQNEYAYVLTNNVLAEPLSSTHFIELNKVHIHSGDIKSTLYISHIAATRFYDFFIDGDYLIALYERNSGLDPVNYLMKVNLTSREVVFNHAFVVEGFENMDSGARVFMVHDGYVVAGSFNSLFGFVVQFTSEGRDASAKVFKNTSEITAVTSTSNSDGEIVLGLSSEDGFYTYVITVKAIDATNDSDEIDLINNNASNIEFTHSAKIWFSKDVTCEITSMVTGMVDTYIMGGGICSAPMDELKYNLDRATKQTPFYFKANSKGAFSDKSESNSGNIVGSVIMDNPTVYALPVGYVEKIDNIHVHNDIDTSLSAGTAIAIIDKELYVAPNLLGEKAPIENSDALSKSYSSGDSDFSYDINKNIAGIDSLSQCETFLAQGDFTKTCEKVKVNWDIVDTFEMDPDSYNKIISKSGEKVPCNLGTHRVPVVSLCYGFWQFQNYFELEIKKNDNSAPLVAAGINQSSAASGASPAASGFFVMIVTALVTLWM